MALRTDAKTATATARPIYERMPEWAEVACGYWPFLRREWMRGMEDIERFQREVDAEFRDKPTEDELLRAVRWMAGPDGEQTKPPTMRQVFRAVYICRKRDRRDATGAGLRWRDPDSRQIVPRTETDIRESMRFATPEDRWEIICGVMEPGGDSPAKDSLVRYAESLPGGVERFEAAGALSGVKTGTGPGLGVGRATGAATGAESACEDDGMGEEWM